MDKPIVTKLADTTSYPAILGEGSTLFLNQAYGSKAGYIVIMNAIAKDGAEKCVIGTVDAQGEVGDVMETFPNKSGSEHFFPMASGVLAVPAAMDRVPEILTLPGKDEMTLRRLGQDEFENVAGLTGCKMRKPGMN